MSLDAADLALNVHSNSALIAERNLDRMVSASERAEASIASLGKTSAYTDTLTGRLGSGFLKIGSAMSSLVTRSSGAIGGLRGLGLQLNQVAQVWAMTGRGLEALAIQLPDILIGFGTMGVFAGIAAAALIPLARNLFDIEKNAEDVSKAIDQVADSVDNYTDAVMNSLSPSDDFVKKFGSQAEAARKYFAVLAEMRREEVVDQLKDALGGVFELAIGPVSGNQSNTSALMDQFGLSSLRIESRRTAAELIAAFNEIENAINVEDQLSALKNFFEMYEGLVRSTGDVTTNQREALSVLAKSILSLQQMVGFEEKLTVSDQKRAAAYNLYANTRLQAIKEAAERELSYEQRRINAYQLYANLRVQSDKDVSEREAKLQERIVTAYQQYGNTRIESLRIDQAAAEQAAVRLSNTHNLYAVTRLMSAELANQVRIQQAYQQYGTSRASSNAAVREAQELISSYEEQATLQEAINRFGRDSVYVAELRTNAEMKSVEAMVEAMDIAPSLKEELLNSARAALELANAPMASALAAARSEASALADEIQRAVSGMMSLSTSGANALKESEIRLRYKDDPVGLAGALAESRFGDYSGLDPVLQISLEEQKQKFVENAMATEQNRIALEEYNKSVREAARGSKKQSDELKDAERWYKRTRTAVEEYNIEMARLKVLYDQGYISADTFARAQQVIREELYDSSEAFQDFEAAGKDTFINLITGASNFKEALGQLLGRLAEIAASSVWDDLMSGDTGGSGGGVLGFIGDIIGGIFGGKREQGGDVVPGRAYIVGEKRPELFVPSTRGTIDPRPGESGGGASSMHVAVSVSVAGARGDKELMAMAQAGAKAGITQALTDYDKSALPDRVREISSDIRMNG